MMGSDETDRSANDVATNSLTANDVSDDTVIVHHHPNQNHLHSDDPTGVGAAATSDVEDKKKLNITVANQHPLADELSPNIPPKPKHSKTRILAPVAMDKEWVKFEEDEETNAGKLESVALPKRTNAKTFPDVAPAVLNTESVHISLNNKTNQSIPAQMTTSAPAVIEIPTSPAAIAAAAAANANAGLRTIELSTGRVREGFANGDVIVTLLPINTKWPWITPAVFRPELVPEELMAQGLTLTVEEYVHAMETLVNDFRFTMYNICYKRVLCCWIIFAFAVLLAMLFSGLTGITLFSLGVGWLFLNAMAIFLCMWMKLRLSRGLERCMALVNKQLMRHKIILALDDRGKISCHKVNLCFIYYEPAQCISYLNEFIDRNEQNGTSIEPGWEQRLDVSASDIVIQGSNTTRLSRKQERGTMLLLRYASRWGNEVIRGLADVSIIEPARHCAAFVCPCQFIERHLSCKPRGKSKYFNPCYWVKASERYD